MIHGIDTDFLVAVEICEHRFHRSADQLLDRLLADEQGLGLAPQTLAEFLHVVTDARRLLTPLSMTEAVSRARFWWDSREVERVFPTGQTAARCLDWIGRHHLGRKRLLDTMLAATMENAGITRLITNNERDFKIFEVFEIISYRPAGDGQPAAATDA